MTLKMTDSEILQLLEDWTSALGSGDLEGISALYSEDAVLVPTVSNQIRGDPPAIREYFAGFLAKQPTATINEVLTRTLTSDLASAVGAYTITLGDGSALRARFSYLFRRRNGGWRILEHHSSLMPEG